MYVNASNSGKNFLSLAHLLKFGGKLEHEVTEILPAEVVTALGYTSANSNRTNSWILNGEARPQLKACTEYLGELTEDKFAEVFNGIADSWHKIIPDAAQNVDSGVKISVVDALKILINEDENFGRRSDLRDWLNDALRNGEKFLPEVLSAVTILAITRGKDNWIDIEGQFNRSGCLEEITDFPHYSGYDRTNPSLGTEKPDDTNSLKAYRHWRRAGDDTAELSKARDFLIAALNGEGDAFCQTELKRWLREVDERILAKNIDAADAGTVEDFLKQLKLEGREWYGHACYLASKIPDLHDSYMEIACALNEPNAICQRMKDWRSDEEGRKLAKKLLRMPTSQKLRGEAYYQLYKHESDDSPRKPRKQKYLQRAWRCGVPEAAEIYLNGTLAYRETLGHANYRKSGHCILNVPENNPIAQNFAKTIPENWQIHYDSNFSAGEGTSIYLFASDNEEQNLSDFLETLQNLKAAPPSCAMFFIRGESDLLTPVVDTALQQWYYEKNAPTIRVQILDEAKLSAQELLARHPLFYPVWAGQNSLHLIVVGEGKTVPWILKEASWLVTSTPRAKITLMSPNAKSLVENLDLPVTITAKNTSEAQPIDAATIEAALDSGDALYFVVDTGDSDLKNMSVARSLRKIHTRAWIKSGKTAEPASVPIAFRSSGDVNFMGRRTVVFGVSHGEAWYNSQKFVPYGFAYTWANIVANELDKIAVAAHMIYSDPKKAEDYLAAFRDYARFTYNQDSSVAAAVSLPYRLFVLSSINAALIPADWDITDGDFFFKQENRQRFSEHVEVSQLGEYRTSLKELNAALERMCERLQDSRIGESCSDWQRRIMYCRADLDALLNTIETETVTDLQFFENTITALDEIRKSSELGTTNFTSAEFKTLRNGWVDKIGEIRRGIDNLIKDIDDVFKWEHERWNNFMRSRGWQAATLDDVKKYYSAGNSRQQCHIAQVHPCIIPYGKLDELSRNLNALFGGERNFDFKQNDIRSIEATAALLSGKFFADVPEVIRDLFVIEK